MFHSMREWVRFYCNAKYDGGYAGKVMRKMYESYLKQNGYEDKHGVLK